MQSAAQLLRTIFSRKDERLPAAEHPPSLTNTPNTLESGTSVDDTAAVIADVSKHGPLALIEPAIRSGYYEQAAKLLAKIVSTDKNNAEAWYLYGWLAAKVGEMDKAKRYLKAARENGHPRAEIALARLDQHIKSKG